MPRKAKEVKPKSVEKTEATVKPVEETKSSAPKNVKKVIFTFKNRQNSREFTEAIHGEGFVALADEFAQTNAKVIAERQDL